MPRNVPLTDDDKALIATEYAELVAGGMSKTNAEDVLAAKFGINSRTVRGYRGVEPLTSSDFEAREAAKSDELVRATSTLFDANGEVKLRWVKADKAKDAERFKEWAQTLAEELPKVMASNADGNYSDDTLTVIPFGDPHLGLHSWARETGDDFDLKIATTDLCNAVDHLVKRTPKSKECLIANLGDYFHADNSTGETTRGHNKLDTDTRWAKVLLAGLKAMRQCITSALEHHEKVTVINAIGNHDDHSSMFLTIALSNIYENEPRLKIIDNPTLVHYYQFGTNMIVVHHGHTIKMDKLPLVAAAEQPKMWGDTKNRYAYTGHIHHDSKKEFNGMVVESFRTLAAREAWAASMGYQSGRDMKAIVHHREYGEVARYVVSVDMLRNITNV